MPWLGLTELMVGGAGLTVKALARGTDEPPGVVTVMLLAPGAAAGSIVILAVIWVGLFTVMLFTVIPEPKLTEVAPVK